MAKKPDDDRPGRSEDAPGHNKPEPKETLAGGAKGAGTPAPVNPDDYLSEQEKVAAGAEPGEDPKKPYPTGNPPSAEDERLRAVGITPERDKREEKRKK